MFICSVVASARTIFPLMQQENARKIALDCDRALIFLRSSSYCKPPVEVGERCKKLSQICVFLLPQTAFAVVMLVYTSRMLEMLAFQCVYLNVCGDRFCSSRSHAMDTSLGIMYLSAHTHGMVKSGNFFTCDLYEITYSRRLCSFEAVCCFQPVGLLALLIFFCTPCYATIR